jgi:hypothetical protein
MNAVEQRNAFLSLSLTQRRLAHEYKRWAIQDEAEGFAELYRRHKAEANRLWKSAKWNLQAARRAAQ